MSRLFISALAALSILGACAPLPSSVGPDGGQPQRIYRIKSGDKAKIQFRTLDSINALRKAAGRSPLVLDNKLNAAAATHSRDMSVQNRPWHFSSDGSSPIDRVKQSGYPGKMLGENISESYESESETLAAWMGKPTTRDVILSPKARRLGFSWYQESNGKIWWTMITGS